MAQTTPFMENHQLTISTLSPVHMGSGEDYDPTSYVLDGLTLYGFETANIASSVLTSEEKEQLCKLVESPRALLRMQSFIYGLRDRIAAVSSHTASVSEAVADRYRSKVGQVAQNETGGRGIINALEISRTAFNLHDQHPLLPGSGLKGALRTAILNHLNDGTKRSLTKREAKALEQELLGGKFQDDPLRLVKISDARWKNVLGNPSAKIIFDNNVPKDRSRLDKVLKGASLSVLREVVPAMSSAAFDAQLNLQHVRSMRGRGVPVKQFELQELVNASNKYYLQLFNTELRTLKDINCLDQSWLTLISDLFQNEIKQLLDENKAILLRVGRHTSAEGITIEGARSIEIPQRKDDPSRFGNETATTLWLAGEQEKAKTNLQPFGWILIEIDRDPNYNISISLAEKMLTFNRQSWEKECATKESLQSKKIELKLRQIQEFARQEQLRHEKELTEKQESARLAALAAMSVQAQAVEQLRSRMLNGEGRGQGAGSKLASEAAVLAELAKTWHGQDRALLAALLPEFTVHLGFDIRKNGKWKARLKALES